MSRTPIMLRVSPLCLVLTGCGSTDPAATMDTIRATERSQLEAIASKDLRGAVRNYAQDAVLVSPGQAPARGEAAIAASFEQLLSDPHLVIEAKPGAAWAAASGDFAVTTATARYRSTEPGRETPVERTVSNQTVWRRLDGRPWQIVADYNVELPSDKKSAEASTAS